jgi:hypothetical protein
MRAALASAKLRRYGIGEFIALVVTERMLNYRHWTELTLIPRFCQEKVIWCEDAEMEVMKRQAEALGVKWSELAFNCMMHWYETRSEQDRSHPPSPPTHAPDPLLHHRSVIAFWELWHSLCTDGLPSLAQMKGPKYSLFERSVLLVEAISLEPLDLIYVDAGELEIQSRGENPIGLRVADAFIGDRLEEILSNFKFIVDHKKALFFAPFAGDDVLLADRGSVHVPLSNDKNSVSHVMIYSAFEGTHWTPASD